MACDLGPCESGLNPEVRYPGKCGRPATTTRKTWRWGDASKNEPTIVNLKLPVCRECAVAWDENEAEARAEAAGS